jgi:hypothetical protein
MAILNRPVQVKNEDALKHQNQKIAVFVDIQNMYYSGKNLFNRKVNFGMF